MFCQFKRKTSELMCPSFSKKRRKKNPLVHLQISQFKIPSQEERSARFRCLFNIHRCFDISWSERIQFFHHLTDISVEADITSLYSVTFREVIYQ